MRMKTLSTDHTPEKQEKKGEDCKQVADGGPCGADVCLSFLNERALVVYRHIFKTLVVTLGFVKYIFIGSEFTLK